MKIIDSYILKKFLISFFFCIILFTAIVVVIDISEKTDDFSKSGLAAWDIVRLHYFGFIPRIDALLFPLFVFISVIFFTAKMADRSEIIAILSSGVSFKRFLLPYWVGSIFLALILWLGYLFVLPKANAVWGDFETKYIDVNFGSVENKSMPSNFYFKLDTNTYAGLHSYDTTSKIGTYFFVQKFISNKLIYNLRSENVTWDTLNKKWKLFNVMERFFVGEKETIRHTKSVTMNYDFKPSDLQRDSYLKDRLPNKELEALIKKTQKMSGASGVKELLVERYNRDAIPVSVIILSLIGAILSSRKVRGGSGFHLAVGVILSVTYILFGRFSLVFATKGNMPPLLAAWVPNILFGILAFYLYKRFSK